MVEPITGFVAVVGLLTKLLKTKEEREALDILRRLNETANDLPGECQDAVREAVGNLAQQQTAVLAGIRARQEEILAVMELFSNRLERPKPVFRISVPEFLRGRRYLPNFVRIDAKRDGHGKAGTLFQFPLEITSPNRTTTVNRIFVECLVGGEALIAEERIPWISVHTGTEHLALLGGALPDEFVGPGQPVTVPEGQVRTAALCMRMERTVPADIAQVHGTIRASDIHGTTEYAQCSFTDMGRVRMCWGD